MLSRDQSRSILQDWQQAFERFASQIKAREQSLNVSKDFALGLIGVRRSGKSWQAMELAHRLSGRAIYLNFEDPAFLADNSYQNLDQLISVDVEFSQTPLETVILDEIQNLEGWERWVRKAVDAKKWNLIVTGSSAKLLSSELATSLAGRCLESKVWPLSYREYLLFLQQKPSNYEQHRAALTEYIRFGGFPAVVLEQDTLQKKNILKQYASDIVAKDVVMRHAIRNRRALDQMITYFASNVASLHSYQAIRKAFGITVDMAIDYAQYLHDAFYMFEVQRYHPNMKVQIRDAKKIYLIDTGLRSVLTQSSSPDRGKLIENVVFLELQRQGHSVSYYREKKECDFIITENGMPKKAIQVTDSNLTSEEELKDREIGGLLEAMESCRLKEGTIITDNLYETQRIEKYKINFVPLHVWLQQPLQ